MAKIIVKVVEVQVEHIMVLMGLLDDGNIVELYHWYKNDMPKVFPYDLQGLGLQNARILVQSKVKGENLSYLGKVVPFKQNQKKPELRLGGFFDA